MKTLDLMNPNVIWNVSLSNGETLYENKGDFLWKNGEKSPWRKLMSYMIKKGADITSLALMTPDGTIYHMPSTGKNPKFAAFGKGTKPLDYHVERTMGRNMAENGKMLGGELFTVARAIYPDYEIQLWVDEANPKMSWVLHLPK